MVELAQGYIGQCVNMLPTREGLALFLGVKRSTLYEWEKHDTKLAVEFSDIFDEIMAEQAVRLVSGGLYGRFNATITKLMLAKHDYVDRAEVAEKSDQTVTVITRSED